MIRSRVAEASLDTLVSFVSEMPLIIALRVALASAVSPRLNEALTPWRLYARTRAATCPGVIPVALQIAWVENPYSTCNSTDMFLLYTVLGTESKAVLYVRVCFLELCTVLFFDIFYYLVSDRRIVGLGKSSVGQSDVVATAWAVVHLHQIRLFDLLLAFRVELLILGKRTVQ